MEAYTDFAYVYDVFMDNTPYDKWGGLLVSRLEKEGITDGILLDLGCGTGNMTELLSEKGYDMIGVDYSGEMLNIAMDKRARSGRQILRDALHRLSRMEKCVFRLLTQVIRKRQKSGSRRCRKPFLVWKSIWIRCHLVWHAILDMVLLQSHVLRK